MFGIFQHRFREASIALREALRAGLLGDLLSVSASIPWWRSDEYFAEPGRGTRARDGGGVLLTQAIHTLDLARMALGDPPHPRSVVCSGGRLAFPDRRETPDLQVATFDYGDFRRVIEQGTFTPYMKKFPNEVRYGSAWPNWPQSSCRVEIYGTKQLMYLGRHGCG